MRLSRQNVGTMSPTPKYQMGVRCVLCFPLVVEEYGPSLAGETVEAPLTWTVEPFSLFVRYVVQKMKRNTSEIAPITNQLLINIKNNT